MNKTPFLLIVSLFLFTTTSRAQYKQQSLEANSHRPIDVVSLGVGFGFDYGGLGVNLTVYPQKNIGLFGGLGYALAGVGYNAGIKLRLLPRDGQAMVRPFIEGMYGYNTAVFVANNRDYNKIFYGPSVGAGIDICPRGNKGYLSMVLLVPIRNGDAQNYMDNLTQN